MLRTFLILGALAPTAAFAALDMPGGSNSPAPAAGGFLSRFTGGQPARDARQVAQFGPPRGTAPQYPQQGQMQPAPQPGMGQTAPGMGAQPGVQSAQPSAARNQTDATPTPASRRARRTPRPVEDSTETTNETPAKKPAKGAVNLDQMVNKLEKEKDRKASQLENELAKAADEATTAVGKLLKSANDGKYTDALSCLTPELQKYFDSELSALNGGVKTVMDKLTRNGDIRSVTYSNATVRGEGAVVDAELSFSSGSPQKVMFDLLKTKNGWKIVLPVNGGTGTHETAAASAPAAATPQPSAAVAAAPAPTPNPTPAMTSTPAAADSTSSGAAGITH